MSSAESKLSSALCASLGPDLLKLLRAISEFGARKGVRVLLVGGVVRDTLLGRPAKDIDMLVVGEVPSFVRELQRQWTDVSGLDQQPRKPVIFSKYGTAKLPFPEPIFPDVSVLEFASAREEFYPFPGGRPEIRFSDLEHDLKRRDFSVNAMAVTLEDVPQLIDPFQGHACLERHSLEVLHEHSFQDDPARMLRAVRFSVRFGFCLEEKTEKLFTTAVRERYLQTLPRPRLFDELRKLLVEENALACVLKLEERGILQQVLPTATTSLLREDLPFPTSWENRLKSLFPTASADEFAALLESFGLTEKMKQEIQAVLCS